MMVVVSWGCGVDVRLWVTVGVSVGVNVDLTWVSLSGPRTTVGVAGGMQPD